jgi:hypothetical protein
LRPVGKPWYFAVLAFEPPAAYPWSPYRAHHVGKERYVMGASFAYDALDLVDPRYSRSLVADAL